MSAGIDVIATAQPHLVPGYAGYCPQFRFRCGETYGNLTHKLLLDPTVNHAETLILSNRLTDDYQVSRPPKNDIDTVNARFKRTDPIFVHPMLPGYEGFTPNLNARNGQRYAVLATEGLADHERQQLRNQAAVNKLERVGAIESGRGEPRSTTDRLLVESQFKLPMVTVRPDCAGVIRNLPLDEQYEKPRDHSTSPYFMNNANPAKYFITGYAGHVPYAYAQLATSNVPMTNSALCDFTSNYRMRQSTEWAPITITRADSPLHMEASKIYHRHIGLLPNYRGHVPGALFRFGKTFGADTKDAKRWLRGDFSM